MELLFNLVINGSHVYLEVEDDLLKFSSQGTYTLSWSLSGVPWLERTSNRGEFTINKIINRYGVGTRIVGDTTHILKDGIYPISVKFGGSKIMSIYSFVQPSSRSINGFAEFYDRSYRDITNISSHNCQAIDQNNSSKLSNCLVSLNTSNQSIPIYTQLMYGVRILQFQLHYDLFGKLVLSHGPWIFDPARITFANFCSIIAGFISKHPDTLLTLIVNNATGKSDDKVLNDMEAGLDASNLTTKCFKFSENTWPTCGEIVTVRQKNIILISNIYTNRPFNNNDRYLFSSRYDYKTVDEFINEDLSIYDRKNPNYYWKGREDIVGDKTKTLWMMSNSITPHFYAGGCITKARQLNLKKNMHHRYQQFNAMLGQGNKLNMIGIDFLSCSMLEALEFFYEVNGLV